MRRSAPLSSVFFLIPFMSGSTPPMDGATSTCALGEGSETFGDQTAISHLPTRHVSTNGSENLYSRGQSRAIHEFSGSHLAVCQPTFLETVTLAPGRRQSPCCQGHQIREAIPPRKPRCRDMWHEGWAPSRHRPPCRAPGDEQRPALTNKLALNPRAPSP